MILKILTCYLIAIIGTSGRSSLKNIDLVRGITRTRDVIVEGESVELECRIDDRLTDKAEIAWVKLDGLNDVVFLSTRRKEDGVTDYEEEYSSFLEQEEGELVWGLTIARATTDMSGFYQCEVLLDDEPLSSRKVLINVESRDANAIDDPENMVYVYSKMGENVTLNCTDSHANDQVTWSLPEVGNIDHVDRKLPLIHVDKSHSGVYTCSVKGSNKMKRMSLLVKHSPIVSTRDSHVLAELGDAIQLDCEVEAVPVPAVSWNYGNGSQGTIESQGNRWITIQDYEDGKISTSLNIRNVSLRDFGKYSCHAENSEGMSQSFIFLHEGISRGGSSRHSSAMIVITGFISFIF